MFVENYGTLMKKHIILSTLAMWLVTLTSMAQGGLLVTGIVKDKETRQALANVNISVQGTNIGTVTNADGVFSLKASLDELGRGVVVSHLGYQNALVSAEVLTDQDKRPTIWLSPTVFTLDMGTCSEAIPVPWSRRPSRVLPTTTLRIRICFRLSIVRPSRSATATSV